VGGVVARIIRGATHVIADSINRGTVSATGRINWTINGVLHNQVTLLNGIAGQTEGAITGSSGNIYLRTGALPVITLNRYGVVGTVDASHLHANSNVNFTQPILNSGQVRRWESIKNGYVCDYVCECDEECTYDCECYNIE